MMVRSRASRGGSADGTNIADIHTAWGLRAAQLMQSLTCNCMGSCRVQVDRIIHSGDSFPSLGVLRISSVVCMGSSVMTLRCGSKSIVKLTTHRRSVALECSIMSIQQTITKITSSWSSGDAQMIIDKFPVVHCHPLLEELFQMNARVDTRKVHHSATVYGIPRTHRAPLRPFAMLMQYVVVRGKIRTTLGSCAHIGVMIKH